MSWPQILGDVLVRAACLVGLAVAPPFLRPEPDPPSRLLLDAVVSLVLLAAAAQGARRLRAAYLTALHADRTFASARYNLASLTLRYGVVDEAKHHAEKFAEAFPNDPRNAELERLIAGASPPKP